MVGSETVGRLENCFLVALRGFTLQVEHGRRTDVIKLSLDGGTFQRNGSAAVPLPMRVEGNMEPGAEHAASAAVNPTSGIL